jgi:DNA-binding response OmpR family regulator
VVTPGARIAGAGRQAGGAQLTALVVDDDHKLIAAVRMYLEREGFRIIAAHGGAPAPELFAQTLAHAHAFDEADVVDRTVHVHAGKLREKLGDDPARPRFIQTVHGVGDKLLEAGRAG